MAAIQIQILPPQIGVLDLGQRIAAFSPLLSSMATAKVLVRKRMLAISTRLTYLRLMCMYGLVIVLDFLPLHENINGLPLVQYLWEAWRSINIHNHVLTIVWLIICTTTLLKGRSFDDHRRAAWRQGGDVDGRSTDCSSCRSTGHAGHADGVAGLPIRASASRITMPTGYQPSTTRPAAIKNPIAITQIFVLIFIFGLLQQVLPLH